MSCAEKNTNAGFSVGDVSGVMNGFESSSLNMQPAKGAAQYESAANLSSEVIASSVCELPRDLHDGRLDSGAAQGGFGSHGGEPTSSMDENGTSSTPPGDHGRGPQPLVQEADSGPSIRVPGMAPSPETGQDKEGSASEVRDREAEAHQHRQHDHRAVGDPRASQDLRNLQTPSLRPPGFREVQCQDLFRGHDDRARILQLDQRDCDRRPVRSPSPSLPPMARAHQQRGDDLRGQDEVQDQGSSPWLQGYQEGRGPSGGNQLLLQQSDIARVQAGCNDVHDDQPKGRGGSDEGGSDAAQKGGQASGIRVRGVELPDGAARDGLRAHMSQSEVLEEPEMSGLDDPETSHVSRLSASQLLSQQLSLGRARHLEEESWASVPRVFEGLVTFGRTVLMEVACSETSLLAKEVQELCGDESAASRCSWWNNCDLATDAGVRLVLNRIELEQPAHVWISPPCGPYSPLQNVNSRTEAQKEELRLKREAAMRIYVGACVVFHACVQRGIHVTLELSERCQAWRLPIFQSLRSKYGLYQTVAKGCRVGLRDKAGVLMQKGWRVLTTHRRLSELLELPCRCPKTFKHGKCEGSAATQSELYTKEFAKRAAKGIVQELDLTSLMQECNKTTSLPPQFGLGSFCTCNEVSLPLRPRKCGMCLCGENTGDTQGPSSYLVEEDLDEALHVNQDLIDMLEAKAKSLNRDKAFQHDQCEAFLRDLQQVKDCSHRNIVSSQASKYLVFGAYSHGNQYGITKRTLQFPQTVGYLLSYLKYWSGKAPIASSLVINFNHQVAMHRDVHNSKEYPNSIIGLGPYKHGELWVEGTPLREASQDNSKNSERGTKEYVCHQVLPDGRQVPGSLQDIRQQLTWFSPKAWHGPLKWEGERFTVGSYVTRGHNLLGSEDRGTLVRLGFNLPKGEPERACAAEGLRLGPRHPIVDPETLNKLLYRLHAATGHGSISSLIQLLKKRNVSPAVLEAAEKFKCSVCQEKAKIQPRHLASLEPLPPRFHTVSTDIGHWNHPQTGEPIQFMLIIDEGSRFRVAKALTKGSKQQPNAATCIQYLREGWSQYFGMPRTLRLDPGGAFRSQRIVEFCDQEGIYLDNTPADAHWQIGVCEQAIKGTKEVMTKMCSNDPDISPEVALATAISTFNNRDSVRGFSPIQHVFGQSPDSTGRFLQGVERLPEEFMVESATRDLEQAAKRRAEAEKAHSEWVATQRISRALNSKPKPPFNFRPGDLVYFWRSQEAGQSRRSPGSKQGRFLGPARVLATETRQDSQGQARAGSCVWCVRGRNLIKCSPEQLRYASEREELLESLAKEHGHESTPWTYTRVAAEIGGSQYQDISEEVPSDTEWSRAQDILQEVPPVRFRFRGKRAQPEPQEMPDEPEGGDATSSRNRAWYVDAQGTSLSGSIAGEKWYDHVPESAWFTETSGYWNDKTAAVEIEVSLPESRQGMEQATRHLEAYFTGALKRRAVEVSERRLSPEDYDKFQTAKSIEIKNYLAAQAFEVLPPHLQPPKEKAIQMRWLLTWKVKDDGSTKPKARCVILGYQDEAYEHRATSAPVMTKQTRQLFLQLAANSKWKVSKGDITGAFLQGKELTETLYCIPTDEICAALNIASGSVTRLRRAAYGLVQAPLQWYLTIAEFLEEIGLERLRSDPCAWVWRPDKHGRPRAMVVGHVDDFLFAGSDSDKGWLDIVRRIKERFAWGSWDEGDFVQCGVRVQQVGNGFRLSQEAYASTVPEIPVSSSRRKDRNETTTAWEKSKLRATLGAISWHAQQVAPHFSAEVGLLLSEVNTSTVSTLLQANQLVSAVRARKRHELLVHSFPEGTEMACYAWVDAANENRHDGGSTQGIFIGMAPAGMLQGELGQVTPVAWHSHKIDRVCRSPGAAETQAAVNGEDNLYFVRYQWSEMLYGLGCTKTPDKTVSRIVGCVVSDSRNVYDKLQSEVLTIKGAEKKANIELLSLKEAQQRTQVIIRWVHSEAQLGNSLTKKHGGKELELFYKMAHTWKIVEDPLMRSARKRKSAGLDSLEGDSKPESKVVH